MAELTSVNNVSNVMVSDENVSRCVGLVEKLNFSLQLIKHMLKIVISNVINRLFRYISIRGSLLS